MKKYLNFNLFSVFLVAFILLCVALRSYSVIHQVESEVLQDSMNIDESYQREGGLSDVEGYGYLVESIGNLLGRVSISLVKLILVTSPFVLACILLVLSTLARICYSARSGRLLLYRILMTLVYLCMMFMLLISIAYMVITGGVHIVALICAIYLFFAIVFGMKNTYSSRIRLLNVREQA